MNLQDLKYKARHEFKQWLKDFGTEYIRGTEPDDWDEAIGTFAWQATVKANPDVILEDKEIDRIDLGDGYPKTTIMSLIYSRVNRFLERYLYDEFDNIVDEILSERETKNELEINLLKTSDIRIVTGGKLIQFCPDSRIMDLREDYISETGERISIDDWLDCWETADLDELEDATADQISYLRQDDNGNWQVL